MDDKIYASIRMTDSITQQDASFEQVRFTNAISTTNRRRSRFNLRLVMLCRLLLSACFCYPPVSRQAIKPRPSPIAFPSPAYPLSASGICRRHRHILPRLMTGGD